MHRPHPFRMLGRGLVGRCPHCGSGGLFRRWVSMVDRCPGCGLVFGRTEGQWLGGMIMNWAGVSVIFVVAVIGPILWFWPEVPWGWIYAGGLVTVGLFPVVSYPASKTLWLAIDLLMRPPEEDEFQAERPGQEGRP